MDEKKDVETSDKEMIFWWSMILGFLLFAGTIIWILTNLTDIQDSSGGGLALPILIWGYHFSFLAEPTFWYLIGSYIATHLTCTEILYWTSDKKIGDNESIYGKTLELKKESFGIGFLASCGIWGYILFPLTALDKYGLDAILSGTVTIVKIVVYFVIASGAVYLYIWANSYKFRRQVKETLNAKTKKGKKDI